MVGKGGVCYIITVTGAVRFPANCTCLTGTVYLCTSDWPDVECETCGGINRAHTFIIPNIINGLVMTNIQYLGVMVMLSTYCF